MKTTIKKTGGIKTTTNTPTHAIYKNDKTNHKYLIHHLGINEVSLGLKDFPEIEQDIYVKKDELILV